MEKAFVSWSGGKDCCQAAYLAREQGYDLQYLVNMVTEDKERSCSHGIASRWVRLQAQALAIPVIQEPTSRENYEAVFIQTLAALKRRGVTHGIFGDIDFLPHLDWIEKVCRKAEVTPVLPLWGENQSKVAGDFIDLRFTAIVIATQADIMGREWLGRTIDRQFLKDLADSGKNITPCGEAGEFHSLVIDGPLFKKRMDIIESETVRRGDNWYLDIRQCELKDK